MMKRVGVKTVNQRGGETNTNQGICLLFIIGKFKDMALMNKREYAGMPTKARKLYSRMLLKKVTDVIRDNLRIRSLK